MTMNPDRRTTRTALAAVVVAGMLGIATVSQAAVSAEEAKQLGTTLTPWGAEKAGNKDGSIPAYTGEPVKIPAGFDPKNSGVRPDPFADDKPLFSITAQNVGQYADRLTEGQKLLFKTFPKYRMDVYQSRRTARYPDFFVKNAMKNATECKTTNNELLLVGCYGGTMFPIPKTGAEVMWNHVTQYMTSAALLGRISSYLSTSTGTSILQANMRAVEQFPIYDPANNKPLSGTTVYFQNRTDFVEPARKNGEVLVVIDALDSTRRVYSYIPGQRRVKLAPDVAYDTPNPTSGGSMNMDDSLLFYGAMDRWNFKLLGKKELFIIYNAFKSQDPLCPVAKLMTLNFMNPDCIRWEAHRVWVVEATLKPGMRHNYVRRTFYFDEDIPQAGTADNYDASGKIYRISNLLPFPMYELQGHEQGQNATVYMSYDLTRASYAVLGTSEQGGWTAIKPKNDVYFSPEALAGEGIR